MDSSRGNKFDYVVTGLLKVNNNVVGTSYNLKSLFPTRRINYGPPKCGGSIWVYSAIGAHQL